MAAIDTFDKMSLCNLSLGTIYTPPVPVLGSVGVGTTGTNYYFAISMFTNSANGTAQTWGQSVIGTVMETGTLGTAHTLFWTPNSAGSFYEIFKGTSAATVRPYAQVGYGTGTYMDTTPTVFPTTGTVPTANLAYSYAMTLPGPVAYNPSFDKHYVVHDLTNLGRVVYNKGDRFVCNLAFEDISKDEFNDLKTIYNWGAPLRFFPRKDSSPTIYFDVYWANGWNFAPTVNTFITGNWSGNIRLEGISRIISITDVV